LILNQIRINALFCFKEVEYDENMSDLEKSILATLAYDDVLERPLTGWEVFRYLIRSNSKGLSSRPRPRFRQSRGISKATLYEQSLNFERILETLDNSPALAKLIGQKNGFYFLKDRTGLVKQRITRQKLADQRWGRIRRMIKLLQSIPYIRLIMLSGSLAMNNPKKESDIDLLIVTKAGRIWTCRALTTLFIHLLGQRRHDHLTENRFCLNHYLTDRSLKVPFPSLYNAQTYAHLISLWQAEAGLYQKFQKANRWLNDYLFFYPISQKGYFREIKSNWFFTFLRESREFILDSKLGDVLELILRKIQSRRISHDDLTYQAGGRVVFDNNQLEFHPDSPEKGILEKYNQRIKELGLADWGEEKDSGLRM